MQIVGPFANDPVQQGGSYGPEVTSAFTSTVATGLRSLGHSVTMATGCDDPHCVHYNASSVRDAVRDADLVVVCLGTGGWGN